MGLIHGIDLDPLRPVGRGGEAVMGQGVAAIGGLAQVEGGPVVARNGGDQPVDLRLGGFGGQIGPVTQPRVPPDPPPAGEPGRGGGCIVMRRPIDERSIAEEGGVAVGHGAI